MTTINLEEIAEQIGATFIPKDGLPVTEVDGVNTLPAATGSQVSFLSTDKYASELLATKAHAVIVSPEYQDNCPSHLLVMDDPYLGLAKTAQLFDTTPRLSGSIHESAVIDDTAVVPKTCAVAANVVIGANVRLGENCQIHPGVVIAQDCLLGDDVVIYPNVVIYHSVQIGNRCMIHAGAIIGSDGFGLANDRGRWHKIPQTGSVIIEDDVEIGATTTIDRGALGDTVIEMGVKLDNQLQVAHNVRIGAHTAMAGQSVVAGSTTIGKHCMIGGASAISGHIELVDGVIVTGMSGVPKSINKPGTYSSSPQAREAKTWFRALANLYRVDKLHAKFKQLEKRLSKIEKK